MKSNHRDEREKVFKKNLKLKVKNNFFIFVVFFSRSRTLHGVCSDQQGFLTDIKIRAQRNPERSGQIDQITAASRRPRFNLHFRSSRFPESLRP